MSIIKACGAAIGFWALVCSHAQAQGVAFQPNVATFPDGVMLSTTPVVSADRRYVRIGVSPVFTNLAGFNTYQVPAAVSGGGVGAGGLGAVPGLGGALGGAGGGMRSVPAAGAGRRPGSALSVNAAIARGQQAKAAAALEARPKALEIKVDRQAAAAAPKPRKKAVIQP